jgi:hypothetical protein
MAIGLMVLAGCSGGSRPQFAREIPTVILPGPPGAPKLVAATSDPRNLPGVDTSSLVERERKIWWKLVNELYAPCSSEAVSIGHCVEQARQCAACTPAAQFLVDRVRRGAAPDEARSAYGMRFGPNFKKVEIADSPSRGPLDAPVTILVWSDFECPHCRMAMPLLERLFTRFSPKIRLVHKFYPLRSHSNAEASARAAIAAQNQGRYWEMEQVLFDHQSEQTDADLERYATTLQLDMKRWRADLRAPKTDAVLARDRADADRSGLTGTPFILINGREFDLGQFQLQGDLEAWVALEVDLTNNR